MKKNQPVDFFLGRFHVKLHFWGDKKEGNGEK